MTGLRFLVVAALGLWVAFAGAPARAEAPALSDAQKTAVEKVVHDYLVANPDVLVEAMSALRDRQQKAENEDRVKALKTNHAALYNDPAAPVAGNPKGDVTMVEFFDYACPYCKSVEEDLKKLLESDGKVRLVLKEFPVLGPNSMTAAKAALASRAQGKYVAFHDALMTTRGQFNEETVLRIARSVGIDTDRLKADMGSPEIEAALKANRAVAESLAIRGTPAFIVGDEVFPGAMDLAAFKQVVAAARKG